jgi:uncharacterized phage protein gp47/JayE
LADPIIPDPIAVDPEDLFNNVFVAYMQSQIPGWEPADGSLDVWLGLAFSQIAAQLGELAQDVDTSVFRWYGANIAGLPPVDAVAATSTVTITAVDTAGYTIAAGTNLAVAASDGTLFGFELSEDAVIAAASSSVAGVGIVAQEAGEAANALSGPVQMVDSLAYVATVTLDADTAGGSDAEEDADYLERLVAEERLRSVAPILARDFAQLSKRVLEVERTAYLDGYNTADGTSANALMVTLVPVQADGSNVSPAGKTAVAGQFAEDGDTPALVGFVVNVADPHRTAVDVAFTATARDGFDPADVAAQGVAAIESYFDPSLWGQPQTGELRLFEVVPKVTLGALYSVLYAVEGIQVVTGLAITSGGPTNPGFETNTTGWVTTGPANLLTTGGTLTRVTSQFHSGVAAGQLVSGTGSTNRGASVSYAPTGGFRAGQLHGAAIWVKGNAGGESLRMLFGADSATDRATATFTATTGWVRHELGWTPAADAAAAYIAVRRDADTAVTFFLDDATFLMPSDYTLPVTNAEPVPITTPGVIDATVT